MARAESHLGAGPSQTAPISPTSVTIVLPPPRDFLTQLPAVLSVIYGNELAKDAVRCVEAGRCGGEEPECGTDETAD